MKKIFYILFYLCLLNNITIFATTYTSILNGNWNVNTNWSPNGIPAANDIVIINSNITYTGNLDMGIAWNSGMNLTINSGKTLTINGNLTELAGTRDILTNNGTLIINGNLVQNQGSGSANSDRSYIYNNGLITQIGDYSNNQNTSFYNTGIYNLTGGNFTINASAVFSNSNIVNINETGYSGKTVLFNNLNYGTDVFLNSGSTFNITKGNITLTGYGGPWTINGQLNVTDGNITQSFGSFIIGTNGGINTTDTDYNGDGILNLNGGGSTITNNGSSYITSLSTSGGSVTITDNNMLFIRDLSIGSYDDGNNVLNVSATGKLYYCSNPVRQEMYRGTLGTVTSGGKLYYSKEFGSYPSTSPNTNNGVGQPEQDFNVANSDQIDMSTVGFNSCPDAFKYKLNPPLPIELLSFKAFKDNKDIKLEWITLTETNNDFFTILKSQNGLSFDELDKIDGKGTTTIAHKYNYIDYYPYSGYNYYKIKQTDYNGDYSYSNVETVYYNEKYEFISIYPNPTYGTIYIESSLKEPFDVKIYDVKGICLFNSEFPSLKINQIDLDFPIGFYYISVITENSIFSKKIEIK